jgi:hypothetical protein
MDSLQCYVCNIHTLSDTDSTHISAADFITKEVNFVTLSKQHVNKTQVKTEL